jgi:hypothetical protein
VWSGGKGNDCCTCRRYTREEKCDKEEKFDKVSWYQSRKTEKRRKTRPATQNVWSGGKGNDFGTCRRYTREEKCDKEEKFDKVSWYQSRKTEKRRKTRPAIQNVLSGGKGNDCRTCRGYTREEKCDKEEKLDKIHNFNNQQEKAVYYILQASSSRKDYGCLQKVVRKQGRGQKSGQQRQGEPRGDRRGGRGERKSASSDSGFKDGLDHDEKTGRTEEEPRHEDFVREDGPDRGGTDARGLRADPRRQ